MKFFYFYGFNTKVKTFIGLIGKKLPKKRVLLLKDE